MAQTSLDIDTAFRFSFKDPKWLEKYAVAALLTLTGIGMLPVIGWIVQMQHTLITTGKSELPTWERLGDFAKLGLKYFGLSLLFAIPLYLMFIPLALLPALIEDQQAFIYVFSLVQLLFFALSIPFAIFSPVLVGRFAETFSIRESLNLSELWRVFSANWLQFLGAILVGMVASMAASFVGLVLMCIGIWFTATIGMMITFHLYGQAYRNARAKLA